MGGGAGAGAGVAAVASAIGVGGPSSSGAPWCLEAYWNRLLLCCEGPVPDWGPGESSDVRKLRVRHYEYARFGTGGAWTQTDVAFEPRAGGTSVEFWLAGLQPEKQYVIQVAAVTDVGQGPWSKQSDRLTTWRVAPTVEAPRLLFRTHTALVLGWGPESRPEESSGYLQATTSHDEEVREFVLRLSTPSAPRAEAKSVRVMRSLAVEQAAAWRQGLAAAADAEGGEEVETAAAAAVEEAAAEGEVVNLLRPASLFAGGDRGRSMLADDFPADYVAVVQGLTPNRSYTCAVGASTNAGEGKASPNSPEMLTLEVAPRVDGAKVDEVQHDQIQISWELLRPRPLLPPEVCEQFGLTSSIDELELRGYGVRCAAWTNWTRLNWREPAYAELDTLPGGDAGRVQFAVTDLEPEQQYVVEVRAHTSRGAGEWRRVSDQPICTAIVAQPPPAPELVYATPRAMTFSFAGVEDPRVVAYEVRRFEGWAGGWCRPSKPLRFDAHDLAVRVTSEKRWVVQVNQLLAGTTYQLQLRGVTAAGGVTRWSARSEAMSTLPASGEGEDLDAGGVGVNEGTAFAAASSSGDQASGGVLARETSSGGSGASAPSGEVETVEDFSKKLEAVLSFTMDYATAGVPLPSVRIPSVGEKAEELLRLHGTSAAAIEAAMRLEDDASWRTKLPDFLIQQVPVVGCSTLLLRELWRTLRRVALIAHLHGHDTRSAETQALIFTCLVPASNGGGSGSAAGAAAAGVEDVANHRRVALLVSRALAKETLVHATGLKTAGSVVHLLEAVGKTLGSSKATQAQGAFASSGGAAASSGAGAGAGGGAATDTAASGGGVVSGGAVSSSSTAGVRDAGGAGGAVTASGSITRLGRRANDPGAAATAAAGEDMGPPTPERVACVVFRPQHLEERPVVVLGFLLCWLLPIFVSLIRFVAARLLPLLARRVQMEVPLAVPVALLIALQVAGIVLAAKVQQHLDYFVNMPATLVFAVYAMIPGISIFMATRSILQGAAEAPFFALLGVYNLGSGYLRWADDLSSDALLEQRPVPSVACARDHIKKARKVLWIALVLDFFIEELLGRVCRAHSLRLLGPPLSDKGVTLVEYRTMAFAISLVAAWAQARLLELLQRRTVLLQILGARKAIFAGLSLLLMGAFAVVQQAKTLSFLRESSPTPWWCCAVLWIRQHGAIVGAVLPVAFHFLLTPRYVGGLPSDWVIVIALGAGTVLGSLATSSFNVLWQEKKEHLESDYRVLHLFPHMSAQARSKASVAMRLFVKKGASAARDTALEFAATRMFRGIVNYVTRSLAMSSNTPL